MNDNCPSADQLRQHLEIGNHLEACPACQAVMEDLTAPAASFFPELSDKGAAEPASTLVTEPLSNLAPGTDRLHIPGYENLGELGHGGMSVVYKARQIRPNRLVALKVLASGAWGEKFTRFCREGEAIARLQHPNIVQVFEVGEHDHVPFLSLEFCPGGSLDKKLKGAPMPAREAAQLVATLARAMGHAHKNGILHRDLKPANVLLGEDGTPKITDFGLARRIEEADLTITGTVMGTPSYMAPEQADGNNGAVGPQTDVYALGAILYECLTRRPPFPGDSRVDILKRVVNEDPVTLTRLNPKVPRDLETICLKCLRKEPQKRFPSAEALADDLDRFLAGRPIHSRPIGRTERLVLWARRQPALALLLLLMVVGPLLVLGAVSWQLFLRTKALKEAEHNLYFQCIASAQGEWSANHVAHAEEILQECPPCLRHWEWHYLHRLCHGEILNLRGHTGVIRKVAFHPEGSSIATVGGEDGLTKFWDRATGQELASVNTLFSYNLAFSPDGQQLALACKGKFIKLLDVSSFQDLRTFVGHRDEINKLVFSPDQAFLASSSWDNTIKFWSVATGREKFSWPLPFPADDVAFSSDGRRLVCCGQSATVKIWDTGTGQELSPFLGHTLKVCSVTCSSVGSLAASGSRVVDERLSDRAELKVWNLNYTQTIFTLPGHTEQINALAFSADGKRLASASQDRTVRFWDMATGQVLRLFRSPSPFHCLAFSPDGRHLVTGGQDGIVQVWDSTKEQGPLPLRGPQIQEVRSIAFAPHGNRLVSAHGDGTLRLWDTVTGQELRVFRGHKDIVYGVAFSPNGRWLASGGRDQTVRIWDVDSGQEQAVLRGHSHFVSCVAISPNGQQVASASWDQTVRIWDVDSGQERVVLSGHTGFVNGVAISASGKQVVSASYDRTVRIWDVSTGQAVRVLTGHADEVTAVALSADGRRLATCATGKNLTIRVWETHTGQELATCRGHFKKITSVAFSPDGQRLASASDDKTVRIWETETGRSVLTLDDHTGGTTSVAFSPDGKRLAAGAWDATVLIWDGTPVQD